MGAKDPRLDHTGKQDFRLTRMFAAWKKEDDPPKCVKPVPMQLLLRAEELIGLQERDRATMDCIWMAFYYLLQPGEYANATGDAKHPFRLKDVQFKVGALHFHDTLTSTPAQLHATTYCSLTFTTQKNCVKGDHAANGQHHACPVRAVLCHVLHLCTHNAPPTTPLYVFYDAAGTKRSVSSSMILSLLHAAVLSLPGHAGVNPDNIAARSLCSSGAMALLLGGVDLDKIRIVGHWKSNAMFCYLHAHALPLIQDNSSIMYTTSHYSLITRHLSPTLPPCSARGAFSFHLLRYVILVAPERGAGLPN